MKKIFNLIGIVALVALMGFAFAACGGGGGGGGDSYNNDAGDLEGTWKGSVSGYTATIKVSNSGWTNSVPSLGHYDTGEFNRVGNVATLKSNSNDKNIGTFTYIGPDTEGDIIGTLVLNNQSAAPGTYTLTKQEE